MAQKQVQTDNQYDDLTTLGNMEAVRKRPGMYVGSTHSQDGHNPRGLIQLAQEILSNATDEAINGFGKKITLTIHPDQSLTVSDEARGLPMGDDFDAVIRAFTKLHTSGKFDTADYSKSGGLHGVGCKATNALSRWLKVHAVTSVGDEYWIEFEQGKVISRKSQKAKRNQQTGTTVSFLPDDRIFDDIVWQRQALLDRIDLLAYLSAGVIYELHDERGEEEFVETFTHEHGMQDLAEYYTQGSALLGMREPLHLFGKQAVADDVMDVEIGLCYVEATSDMIVSFANGIPTSEGGPHVDGAKTAIAQAFNAYAKESGLLKGNTRLDASDTRDGLILALSIGMPEDLLQFESQTKEKLGTAEAKKVVATILESQLSAWLFDHPKEAKILLDKMLDARSLREAAVKARKDAKAARLAKRTNNRLALSTKLSPARSRDPRVKELLVVEGDSAGGSAKRARDSLTQAVLPLRGKPLNVSGKRLSAILKNDEIATLISVIGAGVGSEFDINKIAYDKLIIMTDADIDGMHIFELLTLAVWTLIPEFVKEGHLYVANAPLYRFDKYVRGKRQKHFALNDEEFAEMKKKYRGWSITRMKGLGEMSPDDLKVTTVAAGSRRLTQVTVEDAQRVSQMLSVFMGNTAKQAQMRKDWVRENVVFDEGLDD